MEEIKMTLDTGASVCALPPVVAAQYGTEQDEMKASYNNTFGQVKPDVGLRKLDVATEAGKRKK